MFGDVYMRLVLNQSSRERFKQLVCSKRISSRAFASFGLFYKNHLACVFIIWSVLQESSRVRFHRLGCSTRIISRAFSSLGRFYKYYLSSALIIVSVRQKSCHVLFVYIVCTTCFTRRALSLSVIIHNMHINCTSTHLP